MLCKSLTLCYWHSQAEVHIVGCVSTARNSRSFCCLSKPVPILKPRHQRRNNSRVHTFVHFVCSRDKGASWSQNLLHSAAAVGLLLHFFFFLIPLKANWLVVCGNQCVHKFVSPKLSVIATLVWQSGVI